MEQGGQLLNAQSEDSVLAPSEDNELQSDDRELTASPVDHGTTMHASTEQLLDDDEDAPTSKEEGEKTSSSSKKSVPASSPTGPGPSSSTNTGHLPSEDSSSYRSTIPAGHASTLLFPLPKRPLSTAVDNTTEGDLIYDRLPATLQRSAKPPHAGSAKADYPTVVPPKPTSRMPEFELQDQERKKVDLAKKSPSHSHPNNHMTLTIISMVLCGIILNIFAFTCLIPAYIFAKKSTRRAEDGDIGEAEDYAKKTFILNIVAVAVTFFAVLIILIVTQAVFGAVVYQ